MPENRNSLLPLALAFMAGVAVGANWPQLKKQLGPLLKMAGGQLDGLYSQFAGFFAEGKERFEDFAAERRYGKKQKTGYSSAEAAFLAGLAQAAGQPKRRKQKPRKARPGSRPMTAEPNPA